MFKKRPILASLCFMFVCGLLGAYHIKRKYDQIPITYQALAKIVLGKGAAKKLFQGQEGAATELLARILVSENTHRDVVERIRGKWGHELGPKLDQLAEKMTIRCKLGETPGLILIFSVGSEPWFTRAYLDELIAEVIYRSEALNEAESDWSGSGFYINQLASLQEDLEGKQYQLSKLQALSTLTSEQTLEISSLASKITQIEQQRVDIKSAMYRAEILEKDNHIWVHDRASWAYRISPQVTWKIMGLFYGAGVFYSGIIVALAALFVRLWRRVGA